MAVLGIPFKKWFVKKFGQIIGWRVLILCESPRERQVVKYHRTEDCHPAGHSWRYQRAISFEENFATGTEVNRELACSTFSFTEFLNSFWIVTWFSPEANWEPLPFVLQHFFCLMHQNMLSRVSCSSRRVSMNLNGTTSKHSSAAGRAP